jgi:hypothetical protein
LRTLDCFDFGRESKLQQVGKVAVLCCSLELSGIPESNEILEKFGSCELGTEMIIFKPESVLSGIENFGFYQTSLQKICIAKRVEFIGEYKLVWKRLETHSFLDRSSIQSSTMLACEENADLCARLESFA